jgi:hypothetical protein
VIIYDAKRYWCAAFFWRRAPNRDRRKAVETLASIASSPTHKAQSRAANLLKEIRHGTTEPGRTYEG